MHEALVQHPDGSFVVAGSSARPGQPFRIQLIKTDLRAGIEERVQTPRPTTWAVDSPVELGLDAQRGRLITARQR